MIRRQSSPVGAIGFSSSMRTPLGQRDRGLGVARIRGRDDDGVRQPRMPDGLPPVLKATFGRDAVQLPEPPPVRIARFGDRGHHSLIRMAQRVVREHRTPRSSSHDQQRDRHHAVIPESAPDTPTRPASSSSAASTRAGQASGAGLEVAATSELRSPEPVIRSGNLTLIHATAAELG